ncbi:FecR family protein [Pedobacter nototheniae]|uniref:FecR family protein n=1 Tax=Pedobacter nototheniae TaxID=2488994 RepID=UPI00292DD3D0|nr:FecR domain-containing protein [Pedobacter nototheniae]
MNDPKTDQEFKELARKCELGIATEAEQKAFDQAYDKLSVRHQDWNSDLMGDEDSVKHTIFAQLQQSVAKHESQKKRLSFYKYAAAFAILFSIGLVSYFQLHKTDSTSYIVSSHSKKDNRDYNKAYLTLANGSKISLTDAANGNIIQEAGISVSKTKDGQIVYRVLSNDASNEEQPTINTISTPAGGQYAVILPDNSKVWLNASSSITFPTAFVNKERNVTTTGEVYFEVSKDPNHPFKVKSGEALVSVLGTHFNIMNYDDELNTQVTLMEGSVKLNLGENSQVIKPGEQAFFSRNSNQITLKTIDTDDIIGWKNGYFNFDNTPIEQVMREIKRWYDVDVTYDGAKPKISITAMISRRNKIDKILDLIKKSGGVDFEINNKQITVKKINGGI